MMIFKYEVKFYDEVNYEETHEKGVVMGECFSNAMSRLEEYYGKDNLSYCQVSAIEVEFGDKGVFPNYHIEED